MINAFYQKLLDWQWRNEITNISISSTLSEYIWLNRLLSSNSVRAIIKSHLISLGKDFVLYFLEREKANYSNSLEANLFPGHIISNPLPNNKFERGS